MALTDKQHKAITLAGKGNKNSTIAKVIGVHPRTLSRWLQSGRDDDCDNPQLSEFALAFDAARAEHEVSLVQLLNAIGERGELQAVQYLTKQVHGWGDSAVVERVVERFLDYLQGVLDPQTFNDIVTAIEKGALDD